LKGKFAMVLAGNKKIAQFGVTTSYPLVYNNELSMTEQELFARICQGDEQALDFIYRKYYRMMVRLVTSNNGTENEAKDVYQEAIVVFWQKANSGNLVLTSKMSTYIYSVCLNLWRKELDRKKRFSNEEKDATEYQEQEKEERVKIIHECIDKLDDTCKKVLSYYYFDGMSMKEIAEKIGFANTDTTKTKKYKCKKKLDELIKSLYSEHDFLD
jgi:RNA polymerase sigma factor (sigma-70 family)